MKNIQKDIAVLLVLILVALFIATSSYMMGQKSTSESTFYTDTSSTPSLVESSADAMYPTDATARDSSGRIITVVSPQAGDIWVYGRRVMVNWTRNFGMATAPISMEMVGVDHGITIPLVESTSSDGAIEVAAGISYKGNTMPIPMGKYRIKICDENTGICGTSDVIHLLAANSRAATETMRVISPNGGEFVKIGQDMVIQWWDNRDAGNTTIYMINPELGDGGTIIANTFMRSSGIDGTYSYVWNVGGNIGEGPYQVMVCKSDADDCDLSNRFFTITK